MLQCSPKLHLSSLLNNCLSVKKRPQNLLGIVKSFNGSWSEDYSSGVVFHYVFIVDCSRWSQRSRGRCSCPQPRNAPPKLPTSAVGSPGAIGRKKFDIRRSPEGLRSKLHFGNLLHFEGISTKNLSGLWTHRVRPFRDSRNVRIDSFENNMKPFFQ